MIRCANMLLITLTYLRQAEAIMFSLCSTVSMSSSYMWPLASLNCLFFTCLFSSENVPCSAPTWRLTSSNRWLFSSQNVPCSAPTYDVLHSRTPACFCILENVPCLAPTCGLLYPWTPACFRLRKYFVQLLRVASCILEPCLCSVFRLSVWLPFFVHSRCAS